MLPEKPGHDVDRKKSSKPVMEKKRRARINASLAELKSLQLEIIKKEGTRHGKMEKADILELTVRHLRQLQKQHTPGNLPSESSRTNKYVHGFSDCVSEMHSFLSINRDMDSDIKLRLLDHLTTIARSTPETQDKAHQTVLQIKPPQLSNQHLRNDHVIPVASYQSSYPMTATCLNSNGPIISGTSVLQSAPSQTTVICQPVKHTPSPKVSSSTDNPPLKSLQLLPTRLPNGDMAYVLPAASVPVLSSSSFPSYVIPVFTAPNAIQNPIPSAQYQAMFSSNPIPGTPHPGPITAINPPACLPQSVIERGTSAGLIIQCPNTTSCTSSDCPVPHDTNLYQLSQTTTGLCSFSPATEPDSTLPESESNLSRLTAHARKDNPVTAPPVGRGGLQGPLNGLTGDMMWRPW